MPMMDKKYEVSVGFGLEIKYPLLHRKLLYMLS